jgi:hypothetical protein
VEREEAVEYSLYTWVAKIFEAHDFILEEDMEDGSTAPFTSDLLWCIEENNRFVGVY